MPREGLLPLTCLQPAALAASTHAYGICHHDGRATSRELVDKKLQICLPFLCLLLCFGHPALVQERIADACGLLIIKYA